MNWIPTIDTIVSFYQYMPEIDLIDSIRLKSDLFRFIKYRKMGEIEIKYKIDYLFTEPDIRIADTDC